MRENFPSLGPEDFLTTVFERFSRHDDERLPVLATDGLKRLLGVVSGGCALGLRRVAKGAGFLELRSAEGFIFMA